MREFFIRVLDSLIGVFVVLAVIVVLIGSVGAFTGTTSGPYGMSGGGNVLAGLVILIAGSLYICFVAGFMYLGLGVYHNTKRTAEAVEKLVNK